MVDKSTPEVTLENVSVVQEFSYVFLEDLSGLPPDQELEFGIELLSGSAPISIPLYRMAPVELKELKTQLQDCHTPNPGCDRPEANINLCLRSLAY